MDAVVRQDPLDRAAPELVSHVEQLAPDAGVAPCRVLRGHADHEGDQVHRGRWPAAPPVLRAVVLPRDQGPVPAKNRRRSHQPGELVERLAPQRLALHREPATLSIGQPQPPVPQLLSEHPVLLEQVLDCELLPTVDPARHDQDEKLERERELRHPLILSPRPSADNSPDFAE